MKETFVKDLRPGDSITDYFALRRAQLLEKDGKFRLAVELGDATGRVAGVYWDATQELADTLPEGIIVKVKGVIGTYNDKPQIRLDRIRAAKQDEYDLGDFFRKGKKTAEELARDLDGMIARVENTHLKKLLESLFGELEIRNRYLTAPAAKLLHHDTIGGLAEHSLSMAEAVVRLCDHYDDLDRDILICGALLHDLGKIWAYNVTATIDFSTEGRLIGHINQGDHVITAHAEKIENFPDTLLTHLRHLIVSHQGTLDQGSPVVPMTAEAVFLYQIDELDSRMGALDKIRERTGGAGWSEYQKIFERYFFFGE